MSTMMIFVLVFSIFTLYNSTIPEKFSDDDMAKVVFKHNSNMDFQIVKESLNHKFFLKYEENYLELRYIKKILTNRWDNSYMSDEQFDKRKGKESKDLSIKFYEDNGNEENHMNLARWQNKIYRMPFRHPIL